MKKILITGGTGYIGSHTVVELQQKGYEVIIIDNLSNSSESVVDSIAQITGIKPTFKKIDLTDSKATAAFFEKYKQIDGVIHFAAFKAVGESVENPLKYYHNNLFSLINLLDCMKKNQINNIVFSSSCTVYGEPDSLPVTEKASIKKALSPYGNTKQICEEIITDTTKTSSLQSILLRYFNPIGAHSSALIGELPLGIPNNLIPYITQTAIGKRSILNVYGNDYPTPDGTCLRDYLHVVDLAKAHVIAIDRLLENKNKSALEVFNLGTGNGFSVLEVIKTFEKVSGVKLNYKIVERRAGDVSQIFSDCELANKELGWKAKLGLDEMLSSSWKWENYINKTTK
ncbi:MAG: UDP-glucose 4-epimerase GalE [Bacteroidetes bacterium CG2_30_32_10]|nr:MAG: UDP-glucose 4-epimerase GalE [Bacteroidetes bacterium CG2_30_32_10]